MAHHCTGPAHLSPRELSDAKHLAILFVYHRVIAYWKSDLAMHKSIKPQLFLGSFRVQCTQEIEI
jgi:hypothetical protein